MGECKICWSRIHGGIRGELEVIAWGDGLKSK